MNLMTFITAFGAGVLSFLSPCVLPLVPAYISYITGTVVKEEIGTKKMLLKALGFVFGFSIIFLLIGATATTISKVFYNYKQILNMIAGIFLIILGINLTGLLKIKALYKFHINFDIQKIRGNSFFIGLAFGLGFTPCVGAILAGILAYASNLETVGMGMIMLVIYCLGMGIPFILVALSVNKIVNLTNRIKKHTKIISIISGILVIIIGIFIMFDKLTIINQYFN